MQATTARACWCRAPGQCELQQEALPALKPDDVLVRARWRGQPGHGQARRTRAGCRTPGRSLPAHGRVARVSREIRLRERRRRRGGGKDVEHLRNARVFCLHQDAARRGGRGRGSCRRRRRRRARVLAPNLETAINVVWDAGIGVGDRVAGVGAGCRLPRGRVARIPAKTCCLPTSTGGERRGGGQRVLRPAGAGRRASIMLSARVGPRPARRRRSRWPATRPSWSRRRGTGAPSFPAARRPLHRGADARARRPEPPAVEATRWDYTRRMNLA